MKQESEEGYIYVRYFRHGWSNVHAAYGLMYLAISILCLCAYSFVSSRGVLHSLWEREYSSIQQIASPKIFLSIFPCFVKYQELKYQYHFTRPRLTVDWQKNAWRTEAVDLNSVKVHASSEWASRGRSLLTRLSEQDESPSLLLLPQTWRVSPPPM